MVDRAAQQQAKAASSHVSKRRSEDAKRPLFGRSGRQPRNEISIPFNPAPGEAGDVPMLTRPKFAKTSMASFAAPQEAFKSI